MKILIYIGYQRQPLTHQQIMQSVGVGGTEVATVKLAEALAKRGHQVYLGGQLESGHFNGVNWLDIQQCQDQYFDYVIAASYLHYLEKIKFGKSLFWFHNTDFYPWMWGKDVIGPEYLKDDRINGFVALTNWHANQLKSTYSLTKPVHIIGNAIDRRDFTPWPVKKEPASFIYSSARERGLYRLLDMWPKIKQVMPSATLRVFGPGYDVDSNPLQQLDDVTYMGSVDQQTLHQWQQRSEYWLHPTNYEETYCITALEMQYAGAIPITTGLAALNEVVGSRGFLLKPGETDQAFVSITKVIHQSAEVKQKLRNRAHQWAKQQTWQARAEQWEHLLKTL